MWFIYTEEHYPTIKNKGAMNFAVKCIELENILSKVTQNIKDMLGINSLLSGY